MRAPVKSFCVGSRLQKLAEVEVAEEKPKPKG